MKVLCVLAGSWKAIDHLDPLESSFQPLLELALFSLFLLGCGVSGISTESLGCLPSPSHLESLEVQRLSFQQHRAAKVSAEIFRIPDAPFICLSKVSLGTT